MGSALAGVTNTRSAVDLKRVIAAASKGRQAGGSPLHEGHSLKAIAPDTAAMEEGVERVGSGWRRVMCAVGPADPSGRGVGSRA